MTELVAEQPKLKDLGSVNTNLEDGKKKYLLDDLVKLRKCDIKDIKKKRKIVQIMQYSFQEVLKFEKYQELLNEGKK